jgi:hypothetical protein
MGTCGYNSQKRGLLVICTLQRSLLVTSQILALSEVKAIILSGHYATRLVTYLLLPRVARVVIPKFGCHPPAPAIVFLHVPPILLIRVVLIPRNGWMRSGCAADAQRASSVTTAMVEAKKDRCANDAAPKSPEDSADAPPPPPI